MNPMTANHTNKNACGIAAAFRMPYCTGAPQMLALSPAPKVTRHPIVRSSRTTWPRDRQSRPDYGRIAHSELRGRSSEVILRLAKRQLVKFTDLSSQISTLETSAD